MEELLEKFKDVWHTRKLEVGLFIISITLIISGVLSWNRGIIPTKVEITNQTIKSSPKVSKKVYIDVAGAVEKPGVVGLVLGSRVGEAIASAGGMTIEADMDWVEQNLNLAKLLVDGEKIYIPHRNQVNQANIVSSGQLDKININSASLGELDNLPGVGVITGEKIIKNRPYASIEDLINKKVISNKVWVEIKEMISAW